LSYKHLLCEFQLEQFKSFVFEGDNLGGCPPPGEPPNLVKKIVSHATSYIVSFTFYVEKFKSFVFWEAFWGVRFPRRTSLLKIIVSHTTSYMLVSTLYDEQFKSFILGTHFGRFSPKGNLVKIE